MSSPLEAWKNMTLSSFCKRTFFMMNQNNNQQQSLLLSQCASRALMNSIPPFWSIELTRNGVLEDTFDTSESLFCALPPVDDPSLPPSITNGGYDAEDRDVVRRLIHDYDFFFHSERGAKAFTQLVLKQRLFPEEFVGKNKTKNNNNTTSTSENGGESKDAAAPSAASATPIITNPVRDHVFVGKSDTALIQLQNPSVSRIHCVIFLGISMQVSVNKHTQREESIPVCNCYVVDLASSNGTYLVVNPQNQNQTNNNNQQNNNNNMIRLKPGVPVKLDDGATIRCGTSSVTITVQCTSWADRLLRQKEDDEVRRRQQNENRIRQRQNNNDDGDNEEGGHNHNNKTNFLDFATSSDRSNDNNNNNSTAVAKILNLRKLSLDTLKLRKMQIQMELVNPSSNNNNNKDNLKSELRDVEFVLNEKIQQEANKQMMMTGNQKSESVVVEIVEQQ